MKKAVAIILIAMLCTSCNAFWMITEKGRKRQDMYGKPVKSMKEMKLRSYNKRPRY